MERLKKEGGEKGGGEGRFGPFQYFDVLPAFNKTVNLLNMFSHISFFLLFVKFFLVKKYTVQKPYQVISRLAMYCSVLTTRWRMRSVKPADRPVGDHKVGTHQRQTCDSFWVLAHHSLRDPV